MANEKQCILQKLTWTDASKIAEDPEVEKALEHFSEERSHDASVYVVQAIITSYVNSRIDSKALEDWEKTLEEDKPEG